ncbi:MAG TPA: phospholipid carrier-dependent glycosyltransferase [Candidatus Limnocylindrales bacterium]|nr:phospholipid carrier-dependent glycosyltransferase [Candidatus Limnocylindrales bacterium]
MPAAWTRVDTIALVAIVIGAALMRFVSLGRPVDLVFDEIFYARDACWYVFGSESPCGITDLASRAHPPLGKWLIGAGIAAFGYDAFGWRVAVAVAGTLSVALVYLLAWRLLRGIVDGSAATVGAIAASGLLATDFLHLVQSRVGMLDAFIALFVIGAVTFAVLDRDQAADRPDRPWWWRLTLGRPWLLLAGVCIGAATATKWSGAYVAPAVIVLVVAWAIADQRRRTPDAGRWRAFTIAFRREALPTVVMLGVVPLLVYVASYTGRMPGAILALPWQPGSVWRGIWDHQQAMLDFHTTLGGDHPYQSPPWSWALLRRPVAYWFSDQNGAYREILALGNPLTWWPGLVALVVLGIGWWRARWALHRPEPVILGAAVATYLPWLMLSGDRSQTFLWYFLPTVPFLGLALGLLAALAWRRMAGRVAVAACAVLVVASFVFFAPVLTALPLDPEGWRLRILFANCERPDGSTRSLPDDTSSEGVPPDGWCWI